MAPALTLNTEAAAAKASRQQSPANRASGSAPDSGHPPTRPFQSTTPIPVPMPYGSREPPQPSARPSSPARPTYSPITPPLNATAFPPRPTYTHSSHVDATAMPPPAPEPIDFDSNPDALALKSAIAILQMQRKRAERDIVALGRVKGAALAEPEAFVRDLTTGRVHVGGEGSFGGRAQDEGSDSDSDSDSDNDDGAGDRSGGGIDGGARNAKGDAPAGPHPQAATKEPHSQIDTSDKMPGPPPWASIPNPQNIVRCPPINWSQYAVVGESLDKLHNEQVRSPAQGTPAVVTPQGRFEFKGGDGGGVGKQERYLGVAAPYAPGKDRIEPKPKPASRR